MTIRKTWVLKMGSDALVFAWKSVFFGLFLSGILTIANAGQLLLEEDRGFATYQEISNSISIRAESATISGYLENFIKSEQNPLAFDIILGMLNLFLIVVKFIDFFIIAVVNFATLSVFLAEGGVPGAITALIVMSYQFWAFWHIAKFAFGGDKVQNG